MRGLSGCRFGVRVFVRVCVLLLAAAGVPYRAAHAGDAGESDAQRRAKMMTLSIRIAQAEGNEHKVQKYKSFSRQQRARKTRSPLVPTPGTRVSRPGRTP